MEYRQLSLVFLLSLILMSCANRPVPYTDDNCYGYDSRSSDCIKTVFEVNEEKINKVYKKELKYMPELRGKIVLNIHLKTNGKVDKVIVKKSDIESTILVNELIQIVKTFNFFQGNEYSFHYPLILDTRDN